VTKFHMAALWERVSRKRLGDLFWAGHGADLIRWPAESFIVNARQWIYYGGGTGGIVLTWWRADNRGPVSPQFFDAADSP